MGCVIAWLLWALVALLLLASWVLFEHVIADRLGQTALALSAAAATATIRRFFCDQDRALRHVYEYGRDSVSSLR